MKFAIDQVVGTISPRPTSHKGGWAYMWANQLKHHFDQPTFRDAKIEIEIDVLHGKENDLNPYALVFLDHGMEFTGDTLNLFGGASDDPAMRLNRLVWYEAAKFVSLDRPMADYGALGKGRLKSCSEKWANVDWDAVSSTCAEIESMTQFDLIADTNVNRLVLGDSHSFSMYQPGSAVCRNDGLTMYGALKQGLESYIKPFKDKKDSLDEITLYFGNIDIRHHLMRQGNPDESLVNLLNEYERQIISLGMNHVELISVLPIENESRRLPKTGFYKGTPFAGSWAERTALVEKFNKRLKEMAQNNGWTLYEHPDIYKNAKGELSFDVMEKPQSVHLSRAFYRWDLENDCPNEALKAKGPEEISSSPSKKPEAVKKPNNLIIW